MCVCIDIINIYAFEWGKKKKKKKVSQVEGEWMRIIAKVACGG